MSKRKLFLIDDIEDLLEMMEEQLEDYFEVVTFSKYAPAHEYLVENKDQLDIVVSDFKMPVKNGVEVLKEVKDLNPKTIRIILTGFAYEDELEKGRSVYHAVMDKNSYTGPEDLIKVIESIEKS